MKKLFRPMLLGLLGLSLTGCTNVGHYADADKYVAGSKEYNDIPTSLDIDWLSGNLTLVSDPNVVGVKITEDTNITDEGGLVHSYFDNGTLKIKFAASGYTFQSFPTLKKDLEVRYNPSDKPFELVNIDLTSGSLNIEEMKATKFELDMTSGKANIKTLFASETDIDLTSGSVSFETLATSKFESDLTSGSINVKFTEEVNGEFSLTSGSIDMTLPSDGGVVKVSKTSGSVTTNRECSVDKDTYKFGDGKSDIKVSMTSGKLTIN